MAGAFAEHPDRARPDEPQAPRGWPKQPENLAPAGVRCWQQTCQALDLLGMLSPCYGELLEIHAKTYQEWHLEPTDKLTAALTRQLIEMGLTPAAKSRLVGGNTQPTQAVAKRKRG